MSSNEAHKPRSPNTNWGGLPRLHIQPGMRFNRLIALSPIEPNHHPRIRVWLWKCDCGAVVEKRVTNVAIGHTKSCGCLQKERTSIAAKIHRRTHGLSSSPEHYVWVEMKDRCCNAACPSFPHYGGRGITVSERWRNSFENFYADMGPRPSPEHSIDRIDVNGNYEPSNCRWATRTEQARNRRNCRRYSMGEETLTVAEWAERYNMSHSALNHRLTRGWPMELAVSTPVKPIKLKSNTRVESV